MRSYINVKIKKIQLFDFLKMKRKEGGIDSKGKLSQTDTYAALGELESIISVTIKIII